jgi:hypothetical protein
MNVQDKNKNAYDTNMNVQDTNKNVHDTNMNVQDMNTNLQDTNQQSQTHTRSWRQLPASVSNINSWNSTAKISNIINDLLIYFA